MKKTLMAVLAALAMTTGATMAQSPEETMIGKLFEPGALTAEDFDPAFLAQVSFDEIEKVVEPLVKSVGAPVTITGSGTDYVVTTATHRVRVMLALTADGKIAGAMLQPPEALAATLDDALAPVAGLAETVGYLITKDGKTLAEANADAALAVGSTFKLGILKVLRERIAAGELAWDRVVTLKDADKSLPSSLLLAWPEGAPLTVHTLAALMISQSDNTATDMLLDLAGRDAVSEAIGGFALKTRELFTIKADAGLVEAYRAADMEGRKALADRLRAAPLPSAVKASVPLTDGVEWYISARQACALMQSVADLDVTQINPGIPDPGQWQSISFKGGSEIGVLNLTNALTAKDGSRYCVSMTWNSHKALDERAISAAFASIVGTLARN